MTEYRNEGFTSPWMLAVRAAMPAHEISADGQHLVVKFQKSWADQAFDGVRLLVRDEYGQEVTVQVLLADGSVDSEESYSGESPDVVGTAVWDGLSIHEHGNYIIR